MTPQKETKREPRKRTTIYVLESKDSYHDWQPCRTIQMFVMSWREADKKYAIKSLKENRAHVRSGKMGAEFMRRCKTRYRLSTYKLQKAVHPCTTIAQRYTTIRKLERRFVRNVNRTGREPRRRNEPSGSFVRSSGRAGRGLPGPCLTYSVPVQVPVGSAPWPTSRPAL